MGCIILAVFRLTGVYLFDFFLLQYSVLCTVESLSMLYFLLNLEFYVLGDDSRKPNIYVS